MATIILPIGRPFTMKVGVIYVLPQRAVKYSTEGKGVLQHSNSKEKFTNVAEGTELVGGFVRANMLDLTIRIV